MRVLKNPMTPLAAVLAGLLAGAAGTVCLDAVHYLKYRRAGGTDSPLAWEFGPVESWETAPAPGQVAKRVLEGFTQRKLPDRSAWITSTIAHWAYGSSAGAAYGILAGSVPAPHPRYGLPFGAAVFAGDYIALPAAGLYQPIWKYDAKTLAWDLSAHLAYGAGTGTAFWLLTRNAYTPSKNGRSDMAEGYSELANERVSAANGIEYAYRDTGGGSEGGVPLVLLQHFRGNLDNWDPALIDALASTRRVITFDNAGVGGSAGTTPDTIEQMARDAIAFIAAMDFGPVDLLGFSIGSFVAQQIALVRPAIVRRLVLASAAPQGAAGMHGWAPEVIGAVGTPHTSPEAYLSVFFAGSDSSRHAGTEALRRMYARTQDRDTATTWATREAQYDAVCTWGIPDHARLQRLSCLQMPVFVANGDSDPMILPHYSYLLAGLIPHARIKIYPDSAHGFLFQHHAEFAADIETFLADANS